MEKKITTLPRRAAVSLGAVDGMHAATRIGDAGAGVDARGEDVVSRRSTGRRCSSRLPGRRRRPRRTRTRRRGR